jgi:hypothetical protein
MWPGMVPDTFPSPKGPFDHGAFSSVVVKYYRSQVGASGSGIRISGGGNIRMRNNVFIQPATATFEVKASGGPGNTKTPNPLVKPTRSGLRPPRAAYLQPYVS